MAHHWRWLDTVSLVHGPLYAGLVAGVFVGLAGLLLAGGGRWWRLRVPLAVAGAGVLLAGYRVLLAVTRPWPDPLPGAVWAWIGLGLLGLTLFAAGWRRRQRWWARGLAGLAALAVVAGAADGVDAVYGSYPTIASALQLPLPYTVAAATVLGPPRPVLPPTGDQPSVRT